MITKSIWTLYKPNANYADATYIMGLGCEVEVVMPEWQEFTSAGGTRGRYLAENPYIKITTTCKKQESMLYLKYGDAMHLKHRVHTVSRPYDEDEYLASYSRSTAR